MNLCPKVTFMTRSLSSSRLAWQDRWSQPTLEQLLKPMKVQKRRLMELMLEQITPYPGTQQTVIWYGPSWKWTIHFIYQEPHADMPQTLCYLVPNAETPMICIPLTDAAIARLPMKRLSKFIREGIRSAKCAVNTHWATWTPQNQSEVGLIMELVRRLHKIRMTPAEVLVEAGA